MIWVAKRLPALLDACPVKEKLWRGEGVIYVYISSQRGSSQTHRFQHKICPSGFFFLFHPSFLS